MNKKYKSLKRSIGISIVVFGITSLAACQNEEAPLVKSNESSAGAVKPIMEVSKVTDAENSIEKYESNWESLAKHNEAPQWFCDAKIGIYFHWGVYSVPAYGSEWYPRSMYLPDRREYKFHRENYGEQKEFGYHHLVPKFTAEHFDAKEWVSLFKQAGARFVGPVAQHHDGFAMWNSKVNPWNSVDKGPKKDITGEMAKAARAEGLKFITTFHHAKNLQKNKDKPSEWEAYNTHFPYNPEYHTSSDDKELRLLYGNMSESEFYEYWRKQLDEVIDQYHPDIIWFDSWLNFIPEKIRQESMASYLNKAQARNQEVVIAYKQSDLPVELGVHDIEQGGRRDVTVHPWMTDFTLSNRSWSYIEGQTYKEAGLLVRNLIDVVSKNGIVLLNVSPKADGTIPQEQKAVLKEMGNWLSSYGEAIYKTKPWDLFGIGAGKTQDNRYGGQKLTVEYSSDDVRFTQSKDEKSLYIIFLGAPKAGEVRKFGLMAKHRYRPHTDIKRAVLLGSNTEMEFDFTDTHLAITMPDSLMNEIATVIKLELE